MKNRDWLQDAVSRNDIIRIISDPSEPRTLWRPNGDATITQLEINHLEGQSVKYIYDSSIPGYRLR